MVVQTIKKIFNNYIDQVLTGFLDDPRDFYANTFEATVNGKGNSKIDIVIYDIYTDNATHIGTITLEVHYIEQNLVIDIVKYAQVYGTPVALEVDNLEDCIYDMINRRDNFAHKEL